MSLLSLEFAVFVFITAIIYFILPGRIQWLALLVASAYFYEGKSAWYQALNFLIFIVINYIISMLIDKSENHKKAFYSCGLIFDVLYLVTFKYFGFFISPLTKIVSNPDRLYGLNSLFSELAPLGVSYFALILIAYLTDVYWEKVNVQKNPLKFALYSGFFPLMTSGPIVQYESLENQLFGEKNKFSYDNLIRGLERILYGVFKKLVLSERLSIMVNTVYGNYKVYAGFYVPYAAMLFALQLYTDFSGLMDIVLGTAEIFNIKLPENFDTPFYSLNLSEFWRRWHITLGGFLRDYVMYPLQRTKLFKNLRKFCKNKFGKGYEKKFNLPLYLSLFVSWFLIGLWHGGGWNYIFGVGLYMWAVIVLGELLTPVFTFIVKVFHINTDCFSYRMFLRIRTFILFMFGLSFFRAKTLKDGFDMWKSAFSLFNPWIFFDKSLYNLGVDKDEFIILIIGLIVVFIVSFVKQKGDVRDIIAKQNFVFRILIFAVLLVVTIAWGYYGTGFEASNFIYGRF